MTKMQKLNICIPFIILLALLILLSKELLSSDHKRLASSLVGESLPAFSLATFPTSNKSFTQKELQGRVSLLNIWATWCDACTMEHPMLLKISQQYHVPIYSINYRDDMQKAVAWLTQHGNPYVMTGFDKNGSTAIDLGIYGTPETFVISPAGKIIYRHVGAITQEVWDDVLYPFIQKNQRA